MDAVVAIDGEITLDDLEHREHGVKRGRREHRERFGYVHHDGATDPPEGGKVGFYTVRL